ncbi:Lysophosphatidic acid receptor 6 [Acipenser ruthenus]|uniref:Lysophosphatidic acid receptor 6 n=2 Tax=Acipenser ruthenus TaxID=7906 RepID=A0A662YWT2_ACIRT|nr:Lysophosphatidic acid receptor 6 [Acipenser ruthenus]
MANLTNCPLNRTLHFRYPLYTAVYSLVLILGLPLNGISLWIFFRRLGLRSPPAIYMANLALSDLLFIISLPLRIYYFATARWPFGDFMCMIPGTLFSVNINSSSLFIGLISLDRFLAVVYPLRSRALRTPGFARLACGAVWLLTLAFSIPFAFINMTKLDECNITQCFDGLDERKWKPALIIYSVTLGLGVVIPFIIILFCTVLVIKTLNSQQINSSVFDKQKIILVFVMSLLIYAVCFVPLYIVLILYSLHKNGYLAHRFYDALPITLCLATVNSCVDPVMYYFTTNAFLKKKKKKIELTVTVAADSVSKQSNMRLQNLPSSKMQCGAEPVEKVQSTV